MAMSDIIAAGALLVAIASMAVSALTFRRAVAVEKPIAWISLTAVEGVQYEWKGQVTFYNRSREPWRVQKFALPVTEYPVSRKQDFIIVQEVAGGTREALIVAPPAGDPDVQPGETKSFAIHVKRGDLSTASVFRAHVHASALAAGLLSRAIKLPLQASLSSGITLRI